MALINSGRVYSSGNNCLVFVYRSSATLDQKERTWPKKPFMKIRKFICKTANKNFSIKMVLRLT